MSLPNDRNFANPFPLFDAWLNDAHRAAAAKQLVLPESMAVATTARGGLPSVRMVLLKSFDEKGFVFYTCYESRKAKELQHNPKASLLFHWGALERQIRIEGKAVRVPRVVSEAYWATRPRDSQISGSISHQSSPVKDYADLEKEVRDFTLKMKGQVIPCPKDWGGYRIVPTAIEFWQGRPSRLHERVLFEKRGSRWVRKLLAP